MKKIFVLMVLTFQGISLSFGQVGVNTATPDSTAALDIQSPPGGSDNRGVLFPRMSTIQRNGIVNPAKALIVFDTTDMLLYYHDGTRWLGLVPKEPIGTSGPGAPHVNGDITLTTGTISAPNLTGTNVQANTLTTNNVVVPGFSNNALVPTGAILMWSGNPAAVPSGWALCDGGGGRPDLRGRFIVGYDNAVTDYNTVGNTGGLGQVTLTSAQSGLPAHTHSATLNGNTTSTGEHTHDVPRGNGTSGGAFDKGETDDNGWYGSATGGHNHSVVVAGSTNPAITQDAAQPHENRPPYYVLAYIIKLP